MSPFPVGVTSQTALHQGHHLRVRRNGLQPDACIHTGTVVTPGKPQFEVLLNPEAQQATPLEAPGQPLETRFPTGAGEQGDHAGHYPGHTRRRFLPQRNPDRAALRHRRTIQGTEGGTVLIGGMPRPIAGSVTMDQILVDCGDDPVEVGDEVVLLGRQGDAVIGAEDWAELLGTIAYEIVCGISPRVPRRHLEAPT